MTDESRGAHPADRSDAPTGSGSPGGRGGARCGDAERRADPDRSGRPDGGSDPGRVLAAEELGPRLMAVLDLVGPLYRTAVRAVEAPGPAPGPPGLPVGVRAVLEALAVTGPRTVPQLARGLSLTRQFVQRSVDDAAGRGLVETVDNPVHRRSRLVRLSPDGRDTLAAVHAREHDLLAGVGGGTMTDGQLRACTTVLTELLAFFRGLPGAGGSC